jgi:hypothetical protein
VSFCKTPSICDWWEQSISKCIHCIFPSQFILFCMSGIVRVLENRSEGMQIPVLLSSFRNVMTNWQETICRYIEPLPSGSDGKFEFDNMIIGQAIPSNFIPAIEKGFREACNS